MRFALFGCDDDMARVVARAVRNGWHTVVAARVEPVWRERLAKVLPSCEWLDGWESLLAEARVDAVLVGHERVAGDGTEALKKLVQAGVPILATHPLGDPLLALDVDTPDDFSHPLIQEVLPAWLRTNPVSPRPSPA